jgi:hypothetical protein
MHRTPVAKSLSGREIARMSPSARQDPNLAPMTRMSPSAPLRQEPNLASVSRMSPSGAAAPRYEPNLGAGGPPQATPDRASARSSPYPQRPQPPTEAGTPPDFKTPHRSYVSDDSAMEVPLGGGSNGGTPHRSAKVLFVTVMLLPCLVTQVMRLLSALDNSHTVQLCSAQRSL